MIFVRLVKIFGYNDISVELADDIKKAKYELDNAKQKLVEVLAADLMSLYSNESNKNSSLKTIMNEWYESLNEETKTNLFNKGEEDFLHQIKVLDNNYYEFIENIAKIITGLKIDDWDDDTIKVFIERIKEYKDTIGEFNNTVEFNRKEYENSTYKVSYVEDGKEETRSIVKQDTLSQRAKFFSNELENLIEDYNAVDINEKRQILLEMLIHCK